MGSKISIYKDVSDTVGSTCDMLTFLTTDRWKDLSDAVRAEPDKDKRKELKKHLPCATISGTFNGRGKDNLIEHSGYIAIDIDAGDNPGIEDWDNLVTQLGSIEEVYFAAKSVSGQSAFAVLPIKYPDKHEKHFDALMNDFAKLGINLDRSCRDIPRLRFYAYNAEYYLNENATPYEKLFIPTVELIPAYSDDGINKQVDALIRQIELSGTNLVHDYSDWFKVAAALKNIPNGRNYFHRISRIDAAKYNAKDCDKQFDYARPGKGVGIGTLFHMAKQHGVIVDEPKPSRNYGFKKRKKIIVASTDTNDSLNDAVQAEVNDLEQFFSSVPLPNEHVDVASDYTICEPQRYVCGAIKAVRSGRYNTNEFLLRLSQLRLFIEGGHEINASHRETIRTRWQEKWDDRIKAVEDHLNTRKLSTPVRLDESTEVVDIDKFINTHLAIVKSHNGNKLFEPYLLRLETLMNQ